MSDLMIDNSKLAESDSTPTRRAFIGAAVAAGICYAGALAYPIYRYLASPAEMAADQVAVSEVTLKGAHAMPAGAVMMFKFGSSVMQ